MFLERIVNRSAYLYEKILLTPDFYFHRAAVVGCFINEIVFLEKEGLFLLLDLLEVY